MECNMHASHGYRPHTPRSISLGGALLVNGAIIAGLIYSAPAFMPKPPIDYLPTKNYDPTPLPPPEKPLEQPQPIAHHAQAPQPNAPIPIVRPQPTTNTTATIR